MESSVCAWCGKTPLTREHLIPKWLSAVLADAFPASDGYEFGYVFNTDEVEGSLRSFSQKAPEIVVKGVCEACNSGWMSALENLALPILEPMVRGEHARLDVQSQVILARWAAKTVALLDHYESESVILGASDSDQIFREKIAPVGWHIRMAYRAEAEPAPFDFYITTMRASPVGTSSLEHGEVDEANAFAATLGIGRVAIAVVGGPGIDNADRWRSGSDFPMMIWPPTTAGLEWPPQNPILESREDLRDFHESFWERLLNPGFPRPDALGRLASPE